MMGAFPPLESGLAIFWFWVTAGLALIWLKRHLDLNRADGDPVLSEHVVLAETPRPRVSVLVAAKDEEANIERCLRGLLKQDYPDFEVIAVNDRSDDATGAIIDRLAGDDPRLTAVHVAELPAGWFGKNNAMRLGVAASGGEWLVFTDADCDFASPELISRAMDYAQQARLAFLSVLPQLEANSFWERVVQPVAGAIMVYWNPPQKVNNPAAPHAYANGAFMLMSRGCYEALGEHEAVKATLNEDMHFARRAKAAGQRFAVIRGGDLYSVRMYTSLGAIWRGWSRIFYGCFGTLGRLVASVAVLSLASLSPWVTLVGGLITGGSAGQWLAGAAAVAVLAQQTVLWRFYGLSGLARAWALTYPIGTVVCLGMLLNAIPRALGATQTTWRGTTYRRGH